MNFKDLVTKLHAIEENIALPGVVMQPQMAQQQQDNVSVNINMTGQGSGGIRDLMAVLKNIEQGTTEPQHDQEPIMGEPHMHAHAGHEEPLMGDEEMEETMDANEEDWENSAHGDIGAHTSGVDAVTFKGNDLASKSRGALKHNGGENPMHEAVVQRLTKMYNEIKSLNENVTLDETGQTFQHILHHYKRDVKDFMDNGEMSSDLFDVLYDYYFDDMPYGVKKARSGDPYEWVSTRFANDMQGEVDENLIPVPNPSGATSVDQAKQLGSMMPAPAGQPDPLSPAPAQYQP